MGETSADSTNLSIGKIDDMMRRTPHLHAVDVEVV